MQNFCLLSLTSSPLLETLCSYFIYCYNGWIFNENRWSSYSTKDGINSNKPYVMWQTDDVVVTHKGSLLPGIYALCNTLLLSVWGLVICF